MITTHRATALVQPGEMSTREYRRFAWDCALRYLEARVDMVRVREHMSPPSANPDSFPEVYLRLLRSLSNRQGMPNTIGDVGKLSDVFCGFDHRQTLKRYSHRWDALFDTIHRDVDPPSRMDKSVARSYWVIFCKGSISGAEYLARFETLEDFLHYIRDFDEKPTTRPSLPLLIAHEVFGYGFSLACDFLKELGFLNYPKPDTHLIGIFSGLGISTTSPLDVFAAISLMASEVGETPYAVDKVFWLIGSGWLYLHDQRFETSKQEFLEQVRSNWETVSLSRTLVRD